MQLCFTVPASLGRYPAGQLSAKAGVFLHPGRALKRQPAPCVWVDGRPAKGFELVGEGARVTVQLPAEPPCALPPEPFACSIRYEDEHALVLDKPAGMAVHPTLGYADGTLGNQYAGLLALRGQTGAFRPVNRLDAGTSGLVLCARNAGPRRCWRRRCRRCTTRWCRGQPRPAAGTIRLPIRPRPRQHCAAPGGSGRAAGRYPLRNRGRIRRLRPGARLAGDRPHPPDPGAFFPYRPPAGRGRSLRRQPGVSGPSGPALCDHDISAPARPRCCAGCQPAAR